MSRRRLRPAVLLDRVHGHMSLPPVIVQAIDTAPVQRLRGLKQLGASSFLYPGAVHTRFEHSIGVAHLCQEFLRILQSNQPDLLSSTLTSEDIEDCMLAGLCHDLGHGPFSHLFEDAIMHNESTSPSSCATSTFDHEAMSLQLAEQLLQTVFATQRSSSSHSRRRTNEPDFSNRSSSSTASSSSPSVDQQRIDNVLQLMQGLSSDRLPYGQLVSNKESGLDLDKLDYFARDSLSCFGKPSADIRLHRLFYAAKIVPLQTTTETTKTITMNAQTNEKKKTKAKGKKSAPSALPTTTTTTSTTSSSWSIAYEEKMATTLRELFALRAKLHKFVYQHLVTKSVGHMIADAFRAAMPYLKVHGKTMMECVEDPQLFLALGDWLLDAIEWDPNPSLRPAQAIIHRLRRRELYRPVCAWELKLPSSVRASDVTQQLLQLSKRRRLQREHFVVEVVKINTGKGAQDPLLYIPFYNPKLQLQPQSQSQAQAQTHPSPPHKQRNRKVCGDSRVSALFTPQSFEERTLVVFHRCGDRTVLEEAVAEWRSVFGQEVLIS